MGRSRTHGIDKWKAAVLTATLVLFLTGGVAGVLAGARLGGYALIVPAAICAAVAGVSVLHAARGARRRQRQLRTPSRQPGETGSGVDSTARKALNSDLQYAERSLGPACFGALSGRARRDADERKLAECRLLRGGCRSCLDGGRLRPRSGGAQPFPIGPGRCRIAVDDGPDQVPSVSSDPTH